MSNGTVQETTWNKATFRFPVLLNCPEPSP